MKLLFLSAATAALSALCAAAAPWRADHFPNPTQMSSVNACGLPGETGYLCDPDRLLSDTDRWALHKALFGLEDDWGMECGGAARVGVQMGVAVMQQMAAGSSPKEFARQLRRDWQLGHMPVRPPGSLTFSCCVCVCLMFCPVLFCCAVRQWATPLDQHGKCHSPSIRARTAPPVMPWNVP